MISERVFYFSIEQINDTNASIFPKILKSYFSQTKQILSDCPHTQ